MPIDQLTDRHVQKQYRYTPPSSKGSLTFNLSQYHNARIIRELTCIQRECYIDSDRYDDFLMRGHIQHWQFLPCKIIGMARAPFAPLLFFLRPCYRIREIINGIKVLSNWKGDIFGPASLVGRNNSKEIFINSNIIVFSPVIFKRSVFV